MEDGGIGVWGNVITGAITATATLLGVWLAQRHATAMRRFDRREERRVEQRDEQAARSWHLLTARLDGLEQLTREREVDDPGEVRRQRWWQRIRLSLPPGARRRAELLRAARSAGGPQTTMEQYAPSRTLRTHTRSSDAPQL